MKMLRFETEHFYAQYEFSTPYQLCNSDCETLTISELMALAGRSLDELGNLTLGYTESQGNPSLRKAISTLYKTVNEDHVIVLGTPVEGIYLAARTLLQPSDEVIVVTPAYDALINMFEHIVGDGNVRRWEFTATDDHNWQLDFATLEHMITPKTRLIVVNFPHNPTGYSPNRRQLDQLVNIVEENKIWLFYDEMYYGLNHSEDEVLPSAADVTKRAIVLSGLSKTYGLPGLRTGWLIVQDKAVFDDIMNWKFYTSICPPAPSEFLAEVALSVNEELRKRSIEQIQENLVLAHDFFAKWDRLFVWYPPQTGSTALVKMNIASLTEFANNLADDVGLLIHPATTLGTDDQHMRIGLGRQSFAAALQVFDDYLLRNSKKLVTPVQNE